MSESTRTASIWATAAFVGAIALALVPVIAFEHVITEDGAPHTALATVFASLLTDSNDAISDAYVLNGLPMPNLLATIVLAVLQSFLDPLVAEKVWFVAAVVLVPVSIGYAVRSVRPGNGFLAVLAVPLGIGLIAHFGFYNYMAGFIMMSFTVGYAHRHITRTPWPPSWLRVGALAVLFLLTYLGHILPFLAAVLMVGASAVTAAYAESDGASDVRRIGRRLGRIGIALIPASILLIAYVTTQEQVGSTLQGRGIAARAAWLGSLGELFVVFTRLEILVALVLATIVAVAAVVAVRHRWPERRVQPDDGYLVATLVFGVAYLVIPAQIADGSAVPERIAMFTFVAALMWLASFSYGPRFVAVAAGVGVAATLGFLMLRWGSYDGFDRDVAEYLTATEAVESDTTYIAYTLIDEGVAGTATAFRVNPLVETSAYLVSIVGAVDLNHLHARYRYSPAYYRDGIDVAMLDLEAMHDDSVFASFTTSSNVTVDHVLLWGRRYAAAEDLTTEPTQRILTELENDYELIHVSSDRGLMEVYRRTQNG